MGFLGNIVSNGVGELMSGAGTLAKDIRQALTGEISADKKAEIAMKATELEAAITQAQMAVVLAESQSQDKWTSRGRPLFLYVMYIFILSAIPCGIIYAVSPAVAGNVAIGVKSWLNAIPDSMWALFGAGYLGYGAFRTVDKRTKNNK